MHFVIIKCDIWFPLTFFPSKLYTSYDYIALGRKGDSEKFVESGGLLSVLYPTESSMIFSLFAVSTDLTSFI